MIPAASGATVPKVCTWAITSSARELRARKSDCELTPSLLLLLSSDLHLRLVQDEVSLHLLDGLVRDVKAELLRVRGALSVHSHQRTFSAMARLSHSCLQVPNRV